MKRFYAPYVSLSTISERISDICFTIVIYIQFTIFFGCRKWALNESKIKIKERIQRIEKMSWNKRETGFFVCVCSKMNEWMDEEKKTTNGILRIEKC